MTHFWETGATKDKGLLPFKLTQAVGYKSVDMRIASLQQLPTIER